jgi:hypothetical protein
MHLMSKPNSTETDPDPGADIILLFHITAAAAVYPAAAACDVYHSHEIKKLRKSDLIPVIKKSCTMMMSIVLYPWGGHLTLSSACTESCP